MGTSRSEQRMIPNLRGQAERWPRQALVSDLRRGEGVGQGRGRIKDTNTLYRKSVSEEEPLNTGGKEKYTFFFYLDRKGNPFKLVVP